VGPPSTLPKAEGIIITPNWDITMTFFPRATSLEHSNWTKLPWFMLLVLLTILVGGKSIANGRPLDAPIKGHLIGSPCNAGQ